VTDDQNHPHRHLFHRREHAPHSHDEELIEAETTAGFDLGTDISQPLTQTHHETFDRDKDLGFEPHPE
jgi:hypothetical protein